MSHESTTQRRDGCDPSHPQPPASASASPPPSALHSHPHPTVHFTSGESSGDEKETNHDTHEKKKGVKSDEESGDSGTERGAISGVDSEAERSPSPYRRRGGPRVIAMRRRRTIVGKRKEKVRVNRLGETIFKGHTSYEIMCNIQLGIRVSIGRISPMASRAIRTADYRTEPVLRFPARGSADTPPHHQNDFKFKDYCPMVFRHLREMFGLDAGDFMLSICGDNALSELRTPGKSGALFFFSHDMHFIIKTLRKHECKFLRDILPSYYEHVKENSNTLLCKFFGMYRVKPHKGRNVRLLVMNNIFPTEKEIHVKFDLKGSTIGRAATITEKENPKCIYKDLDLSSGMGPIRLGPERRKLLVEQLDRDSDFLSRHNIMDYSLLLGIHDPHLAGKDEKEEILSPEASKARATTTTTTTSTTSSSSSTKPTSGTQLAPTGRSVSTETGEFPGSAHLGSRKDESALPRRVPLPHRRSGSAPRSASYEVMRENLFDGGLQEADGDRVYYMGIIDVLQQYNVRKKIEHQFKGIQYPRFEISAVPPGRYAKRFTKFLSDNIV